MSSISLSINISETSQQIGKLILSALLLEIQPLFDDAGRLLKDKIVTLIINSIISQPEYTSLVDGQLQYEFGLPDSPERVMSILDAIRTNSIIEINTPTIIGDKIKGSVSLKMLKKDFSDLLALDAASFVTEKGSVLEWLKWLLTEGDSVIVTEHEFVFGPSRFSRTGMGIMKGSAGSFWRVPPQFSGTIKNNWITRAIDAVSSDIEKELLAVLGV